MTARTKKRLTRIALFGAVVALGLMIWATLALSGASSAAQSSGAGLEWYTARVTSFDVTVIATGELEARNQIEVKSRVDGRNAIISIVDEGTRVKAGDLLAKLDDSQIVSEIEEEQIRVEQARADLLAAQRDMELAQQEAQTAEKEAQVKLNLATIALEKWRNGDVIQKRRELDLALERARRQLAIAERDLELGKQLRAEDFISQNELEDKELAYIETVEALETAQQNIEVYNKYTYEQEQQERTSAVEQARDALEQTRRQNQIRLDRHQSNVDSKQRTLELRETRLADQQRQLEATTIHAPSDGLVVYATSVGGGRRGSNDPIQPGREVRKDETIILLPDTSRMVASLRVHEAVLNQIGVGQRAAISIDARPGDPVPGEVISVGVMAMDGGWFNPQLREYLVRVALPDNYDATLKPAMRCTGQIFVGRVENALAVPVQAVHAEGDRHFVYVAASGGQVRRQPVAIGRSSESLVEVTEGLAEGQRVLLRNPRPGEVVNEPGAPSQPSPTDAVEEAPPALEPPQPVVQPAGEAGQPTQNPQRTRPRPDGERPQRPEGERRQRPGGAGAAPQAEE